MIWNNFIKHYRNSIFGLLVIYLFNLQSTIVIAQSVNLAWTPSSSSNLSHHNIYRANHIDSSFILIDVVNHPDSTYIDDDVQFDSHYYYIATVVDLFGNESGFSNMVDTTISMPVPVELCRFSAQVNDNNVILEWSTATESNNYGFEVQRSTNGTKFSQIGFVKGNDTTLSEKHYKFVDLNLTTGIYYYRLKQIDFNGDFEFSNTIKITIGVPDEFRLEQNYPNPFNPSTTISYHLPKSSQVELNIYNMYGQIIYKLVDDFQEACRYTVEWSGIDETGKKVASGIYYYKIKALNSAMFRKMLLVK